MHTKQVFVSRNVVFEEFVFPCSLSATTSTNKHPMPICIPVPHTNPSPIDSANPITPLSPSDNNPSSDHSQSDTSLTPLSSLTVNSPSAPPVRKSTRHKTKPSYLQDYQCNSSIIPQQHHSGSFYPIHSFVSLASLSYLLPRSQ
uniref:Uncharacterized protein n=1 Tax=Cajanus cajan TaxID=3821 RepID=A0A151S2T2_CAJCA|nr:hypothetical protein KK1_029145 [Cajanus cajan]